MFQHRASQFDPHVAAIAGHLRAIEKELGVLGKSAGRRASSGVSAAGGQIVEAIWPILSEIGDSLRRDRIVLGQRLAALNLATRCLRRRFGGWWLSTGQADAPSKTHTRQQGNW